MKKKVILVMIISIFTAAISVSAQTGKPDFSGYWELDIAKSVLAEMIEIETMTLEVSQTEEKLRFERNMKRVETSNRAGSEFEVKLYNLDGEGKIADYRNGMLAGKINLKATLSSTKLSLEETQSFNGETGNIAMKTNEIWELLDEGKSLRITRYSESPLSVMNSVLYFTKKISDSAQTLDGSAINGNQKLPKT